MIGVCRVWKDESASDKIKYAYASAVTAWTPIFVTGLGVLIPCVSADASTSVMFYRKGTFVFPIQAGVTIANKDVIYYDTATDKVTNVASTTTKLLGTSVEAGSAVAGYVPVELLPYPFSGAQVSLEHLDAGIKPSHITIAAGSFLGTGTGTVETAVVTGALSTDEIFAEIRTPGLDSACRLLTKSLSADALSIVLSTPLGGAAGRIAYQVKRAAA
jgi:predicted RecA/RadA family phage recombinase